MALYAHVVNGYVQQFYGSLPRNITMANGLKVSNPQGSRVELASKYGIYEVKEDELEVLQEYGEPYVDGVYVVKPARDLSVGSAKTILWEEARREKRRSLDKGLMFEGFHLATDDESLLRLTAAAMTVKPDKIYLLRCADKTNQHVSGMKLVECHQAVYNYWYTVMEGYWNFVALLEEMDDIEQLKSHSLILSEGF